MDECATGGDATPERPTVTQHHFLLGWLPENGGVGDASVYHQVAGARSVAAVLATANLRPPLRFLNLSCHSGDHDIADEIDLRVEERRDSFDVAGDSSLHV